MEKIECAVCSKLFEPPIMISKKLDDEHSLMLVENRICSKKCHDIFRKTMNNLNPHCFRCGKLTTEETMACVTPDFERRICLSLCNECGFQSAIFLS